MKVFNIFGVITIALMTFVIGAFITYYLFINGKTPADETIWSGVISGVGSCLGGVFGGFVAYMSARGQFSNEKKRIEKEKTNKLMNIIKSLKTEIEHNLKLFKLILVNDDKESYCDSLESIIWNEIRFNIANDLNEKLYKMLNEHFRECEDLKARTLPKYRDISVIKFDLRIATTDKLIADLDEILNDLTKNR